MPHSTDNPLAKEDYWQQALPYYARVCLGQAAVFAVPIAAMALVSSVLDGLFDHHWAVNRVGLEIAGILGLLLFALALTTAVIHDLRRNRHAEQPSLEWNPALTWQALVYFGAAFFLAAAFLSYDEGVWLSVFFLGFATGSWLVARHCFKQRSQ